MAARLRGSGQRQALRDTNLLAHEVDSRDFFGYGVLDLQTRVDLEEPDVTVGLEQELDCTHAYVVNVLEQRARRVHERLMRALGQEWRGSLFDQLLVATLHRAVTGRDDVEVTQRVTCGLCLDVTGDLDKTLDEVSAQVGGVRVTREEQVKVGLRADDADASAAAAIGALEHHGVTGGGEEGLDLFARGHGLGHAGDGSHAARLCHAASLDLVAQRVDDGRRGAEPRDTGILDSPCELGVLGQESVAGMNCIRTRLQSDRQDLLTVQIRRRRIVATEGQGLVGLACMRRGHILIGVNRDRRNAHIGGRAAHAQSDFATVGDEDSINCSHASPWCRERLSEVFRLPGHLRR